MDASIYSVVVVLIIVVLVAVVSYVVAILGLTMRKNRRIASNGVPARAEVISRRKVSMRNGGAQYVRCDTCSAVTECRSGADRLVKFSLPAPCRIKRKG